MGLMCCVRQLKTPEPKYPEGMNPFDKIHDCLLKIFHISVSRLRCIHLLTANLQISKLLNCMLLIGVFALNRLFELKLSNSLIFWVAMFSATMVCG